MKAPFLAAALLAGFSTFASATGIVVNSGWQTDTLSKANSLTDNSAWTFTVSSSAYFRITDCCAVGDHYDLYDGAMTWLAGTALGAGAPTATGSGFFETEWKSGNFQILSYLVGPGSYTFNIKGDGVGGIPADLGVMLEAVPEPETYALMLAGLAAMGLAVRRRQT